MSLHYTLSAIQTAKAKPIRLKSARQQQQTEENCFGRQPVLWPGIAKWFGEDICSVLSNVKTIPLRDVEEIRLRISQPLCVRTADADLFLNKEGEVTSPGEAYRISREDVASTVERMTHSSVYAAVEDLKQGFLTLPGGNRVGVTGEAVLHQGRIQTLKHISGLNLRLAREIPGPGIGILPKLLATDETICHTLLISPPRAGKTTLLRDLIRMLSNGVPQLGLKGQTVGVVDERGELAGMWQGVPTYDLGYRTDVLDGCPKAQGLTMLLRSMAPQVLAMDELGHPDDVSALKDALRTGVQMLSTAHAGSLEEARVRPALGQLLEQGIFERLVVLNRRRGPGTIEGIYDLKTGRRL